MLRSALIHHMLVLDRFDTPRSFRQKPATFSLQTPPSPRGLAACSASLTAPRRCNMADLYRWVGFRPWFNALRALRDRAAGRPRSSKLAWGCRRRLGTQERARPTPGRFPLACWAASRPARRCVSVFRAPQQHAAAASSSSPRASVMRATQTSGVAASDAPDAAAISSYV